MSRWFLLATYIMCFSSWLMFRFLSEDISDFLSCKWFLLSGLWTKAHDPLTVQPWGLLKESVMRKVGVYLKLLLPWLSPKTATKKGVKHIIPGPISFHFMLECPHTCSPRFSVRDFAFISCCVSFMVVCREQNISRLD